jgi:tripartite-type tricarboxylate transporter receptor subunit TctC
MDSKAILHCALNFFRRWKKRFLMAALVVAIAAPAQQFPSGAIHLVFPVVTGGSNDALPPRIIPA